MSSDDYQVQNIYRYCRKSYKKNRRNPDDNENEVTEASPRSAGVSEGLGAMDSPGCSCDYDPEGEIASILHKKCPVISLAQQQLHRLLEGTDKLLCENTRCCRSIYDFLCICREVVLGQNKTQCAVALVILGVFVLGILIGAASCGSRNRQFNSPILTCIDNIFVPETYAKLEQTFRSIA